MQFEFGKDGKPYFVGGPHDTPERCALIVRTLEENCGRDRYDYLLPVAGDDADFPMQEGDDFEELAARRMKMSSTKRTNRTRAEEGPDYGAARGHNPDA